MKLRSLYLLIYIFISTSTLSHGGDIFFQATVDQNTISLSDRLTYTLTIEGARDGNPILPDIQGFEVQGSSVSTQFSLVNNKTKISKNIAYTLMPIKAGTFTISSARLEYGGKTYTTRPIKIRVMKGAVSPSAGQGRPAPPPGQPSQGIDESRSPTQAPPLFIRTEVDKDESYVNEQITLKFNLFSRGLRIANLNYSPPPTVGFTEEDLGDQRNYNRIVEGVRYNVIELSKAIFPITSGEVTLGPAELKGDIIVQRRSRRNNFFDDFFSDPFGERQPFALRSEPIKLTIKPLPREGRPVDFKGAVGDFRFNLTAKPLGVKVGEPITVTMTVTGTGNLDTVSLPEIFCGDAFKTYAPEIGVNRGVRGGRVSGEKIFKQVIIPLSIEAKEIPAVSFSFFNPATGKYRTIKNKPIPIKVKAAPDQGPVALIEGVGSGPGRERIKLLEKDILYIKDSPGHLSRTGQFYYRRTIYWIIPIAALIGLFAVWIIQSRREKLSSDLIYARQVGASRAARKRFKKARTFLNVGDSEKFYGEVHRAFNRYLGDKLGIPSGAVEVRVVAKKLSTAGASAEIIKEVETCFSDFDLARFARLSSDKNEMKDLLDRVEGLISKLEKIKIISFQ